MALPRVSAVRSEWPSAGPPPALPHSNRLLRNFASMGHGTYARGKDGCIIGSLLFGHDDVPDGWTAPGTPSVKHRLFMEFDLGSSHTWVIGHPNALGNAGATGAAETPLGFPPIMGKAVDEDEELTFPAKYLDNTAIHYRRWSHVITLESAREAAHPSITNMLSCLPFRFGIAKSVRGDWTNFPASGLIGLKRKIAKKADDEDPNAQPTFLHQVLPRLTTPEISITLSEKEGVVYFGSRPRYTTSIPGSGLGNWTDTFPFCLDNGNFFELAHYTLDGEEVKKTGKKYAEWDSGTAECYLEDSFVERYYAACNVRLQGKCQQINTSGGILEWIIPASAERRDIPQVGLSIGNLVLELDAWYLPGAKTIDHDDEDYYIGGIQARSSLGMGDDFEVDLLGRVALFNVELLIQLPVHVGKGDVNARRREDEGDEKDRMAWRKKSIRFGGVEPDISASSSPAPSARQGGRA
ncbi:hypothetical protein R3P38DRAFT_3004623 [Favolaschia claudopus]|uniref:Uncharacterized protein n=1 Tax=Favolaschia claudopus TaxID=2862362 RepID=A0AAW0ANH1_9AGAR